MYYGSGIEQKYSDNDQQSDNSLSELNTGNNQDFSRINPDVSKIEREIENLKE